jgi:hypothetical protein
MVAHCHFCDESCVPSAVAWFEETFRGVAVARRLLVGIPAAHDAGRQGARHVVPRGFGFGRGAVRVDVLRIGNREAAEVAVRIEDALAVLRVGAPGTRQLLEPDVHGPAGFPADLLIFLGAGHSLGHGRARRGDPTELEAPPPLGRALWGGILAGIGVLRRDLDCG